MGEWSPRHPAGSWVKCRLRGDWSRPPSVVSSPPLLTCGEQAGIVWFERCGRLGGVWGVVDRQTVSGTSSAWVRTEHSVGLSGRRNRDTAPEVMLRREVHRLGLRFRLHQRIVGRFSVDFALPRFRVAVLVDGCFWHGCPEHGPKVFRGPNRELWASKLADNRARDARCNSALQQHGWEVLRFWECAVRRDAASCARQVEGTCHRRLSSSAARTPETPRFG